MFSVGFLVGCVSCVVIYPPTKRRSPRTEKVPVRKSDQLQYPSGITRSLLTERRERYGSIGEKDSTAVRERAKDGLTRGSVFFLTYVDYMHAREGRGTRIPLSPARPPALSLSLCLSLARSPWLQTMSVSVCLSFESCWNYLLFEYGGQSFLRLVATCASVVFPPSLTALREEGARRCCKGPLPLHFYVQSVLLAVPRRHCCGRLGTGIKGLSREDTRTPDVAGGGNDSDLFFVPDRANHTKCKMQSRSTQTTTCFLLVRSPTGSGERGCCSPFLAYSSTA